MTGVSVLAETVDEYARTHRNEGLAYELPDRSLRPTLPAYVVGRGLR